MIFGGIYQACKLAGTVIVEVSGSPFYRHFAGEPLMNDAERVGVKHGARQLQPASETDYFFAIDKRAATDLTHFRPNEVCGPFQQSSPVHKAGFLMIEATSDGSYPRPTAYRNSFVRPS